MRTKRGCHRAAFFISIASLRPQNPHHPSFYQGTTIHNTQAAIKAQKPQNTKPNKAQKIPISARPMRTFSKQYLVNEMLLSLLAT
ncbi:hypothetical protein [Anaerobiospirillum succiniciproducens]|uniref:hypothetical protein n=1 Tax=Anaerobiospirillum succiniciproducens TaxID=13335 RepID=UPI003F8ADE97